jgi:hypothetical protein
MTSASGAWTNRVKAIIVGIALGIALTSGVNWLQVLIDHVPQCAQLNCVADFVTFYAEGELILQDRQSLYDLDKQLVYQQRIAPTERVLPFVYPPITAALFAPLTRMPFSIAFLFMTALNVLLLFISLRLLIRYLSLTRDQSDWLILFALCNFGVHAVVFYGQTSAIILFFLTSHVLAQKQSSECKAGLWAGLLCLKPQFLPIPHLLLLLNRQWRGLLVGALMSVTLIVGAFIFIGLEASKQYFSLARRMVTTDDDWWNQWRGMHNLRALTIYWLPANWQAPVWWVGDALVLATMIWSNLRAGQKPDAFAGTWIINVLGLLVVIPHLFTHDLTLLILPCALFLSRCKETVPLSIGLGLVALAILPTVNYLVPTLMAFILVLLYGLSLRVFNSRLAS